MVFWINQWEHEEEESNSLSIGFDFSCLDLGSCMCFLFKGWRDSTKDIIYSWSRGPVVCKTHSWCPLCFKQKPWPVIVGLLLFVIPSITSLDLVPTLLVYLLLQGKLNFHSLPFSRLYVSSFNWRAFFLHFHYLRSFW